ncbi:MAG: Spo0E family sporulation regulatory protein-aspartic acid phosphatase [Lachnospiraceae bacterium]|nr:Spo0E family sporulation regulatory protein-aspartic acid phosphatase [Lachnospiraceae bacterium]
MNYLLELQKEIETVRKELDVAAGKDVSAQECYQVSIQLDRLIEDYMQYKEEVQLLHCS